MDLHRQPVVVEAVHEIITTFEELSELPQSRKGMKVGTSKHNHPISNFGVQHGIDYTL